MSVVFGLLLAGQAEAQEILITGPLGGGVPEPPCYPAIPATWEWSYWSMVGASLQRDERARRSSHASYGMGVELTTELGRYRGFPSGSCYSRSRGDAELRAGPWLSGAAALPGGLVEGGLKLHLGGVYHASWGTFDLRAGLGNAAFAEGRSPHAVATVTYGVRSVLARYHLGDPHCELPQVARPVANASVVRLSVTRRLSLLDPDRQEWQLGVEVSPTFFLPPYSWWRLAGGPL
jgi:hypothetical protein